MLHTTRKHIQLFKLKLEIDLFEGMSENRERWKSTKGELGMNLIKGHDISIQNIPIKTEI